MLPDVQKWEYFEQEMLGPADGNPFTDVSVTVEVQFQNRKQHLSGFYDGNGKYKFRIMPDAEGEWRYTVHSSHPDLDGRAGAFRCVSAREGVHGPVMVGEAPEKTWSEGGRIHPIRFAYADGEPYIPVGTTCYCWTSQEEALEEKTLQALAASPFNKIRMCVFPKHYDYNHNEPEQYPFEGSAQEGWDFSRFNPGYFAHLERRILQLRRLGIECDLILFHSYDRWGFSCMGREADVRYLRYLAARLSAFRNVWWSMANEYDGMMGKTMADWDLYFKILMQEDPVGHLRSIHNFKVFYDHTKPWITHVSIQSGALAKAGQWILQYEKPVIVDECGYEGDIPNGWGNLTAQELVHRFWTGFAGGAYVGHGETYWNPEEILWWSKGGQLRGESVPRIAFLRKIWSSLPNTWVPLAGQCEYPAVRSEDGCYLIYLGMTQSKAFSFRLPAQETYGAKVIDTWNCTEDRLTGEFCGNVQIPLPGKPYLAVLFTKEEREA